MVVRRVNGWAKDRSSLCREVVRLGALLVARLLVWEGLRLLVREGQAWLAGVRGDAGVGGGAAVLSAKGLRLPAHICHRALAQMDMMLDKEGPVHEVGHGSQAHMELLLNLQCLTSNHAARSCSHSEVRRCTRAFTLGRIGLITWNDHQPAECTMMKEPDLNQSAIAVDAA